MSEDMGLLLWAICLCIQRTQYDRVLTIHKHTTLNEEQKLYVLSFVLQGIYEEEVLQKTFGLSTALQQEIRQAYLN